MRRIITSPARYVLCAVTRAGCVVTRTSHLRATQCSFRCSSMRAVSNEIPQFANDTSKHNRRAITGDLRDETIFALSTAAGRAGIAIVRISGPACLDIYQQLCPKSRALTPRYAAVRTLHDPSSIDNILDSEALVLYFPGPKTVTGEDVLELHIHGGPAIVKAVLAAIPRASGVSIRYAEPGEFTRRAFQNQRLDLAQVEALSDTLSAETELQRRAAQKGNSGKLGKTYDRWREQLLYARGELEAFIDFSEDQSFEEGEEVMLKSIKEQVEQIQAEVETHISASGRGELLRRGIRISMLGPPNAGKSSLLNRIVGREASIVSSEAGTTRDIVEVSLDIEGYLCTFADTAGLRGSKYVDAVNFLPEAKAVGEVEAEGVRRAKEKARDSHMVILFASIEPTSGSSLSYGIQYDREALEIASKAETSIIVVNKTDMVSEILYPQLLAGFENELIRAAPDYSPEIVGLSCRNAEDNPTDQNAGNMKTFVDRVVASFKSMTAIEHEELYGVTQRQNELLKKCNTYLTRYLEELRNDSELAGIECDIVLAAEHLRSAANSLSRITGRGEAGDVEEVLGVVFEKYALPKITLLKRNDSEFEADDIIDSVLESKNTIFREDK